MGVADTITVAVAQPATVAGDLAANASAHAHAVATAGARIAVFPEMSLTGYELGAPPVDPADPRLDVIAEACRHHGAVALVGAPVRGEGRSEHIATIRITSRQRDVVYRKQMLGGREPEHYAPGPTAAVIEVDGRRIGLGICKDTDSARHIAAIARLDIDVYAAGLVHHPDELAEQDARGYLLARACNAFVAFASFAGPTGGGYTRTLGSSTIWSPAGAQIARAGTRSGEVVSAELRGDGGTLS